MSKSMINSYELVNNLLYKSYSNIPSSVLKNLDAKLHLINGHPICLIKNAIYNYFKSLKKFDNLKVFDELSNVVSIEDNFDLLLIDKVYFDFLFFKRFRMKGSPGAKTKIRSGLFTNFNKFLGSPLNGIKSGASTVPQ